MVRHCVEGIIDRDNVVVIINPRMIAMKDGTQLDATFVGFAPRGGDHVVSPSRLLPAVLQLLLLLLEQFNGGLALVHLLSR